MRLDRNTNKEGKGKYALVKLRNLPCSTTRLQAILDANSIGYVLDYGDRPNTEFFVIRLKDKYAAPSLAAYALAAYQDDQEYGMEVLNLAKTAAEHQNKRRPD